jgi:hypothetical protein
VVGKDSKDPIAGYEWNKIVEFRIVGHFAQVSRFLPLEFHAEMRHRSSVFELYRQNGV